MANPTYNSKANNRWYLTLLGGIIGMLLGLIPSAVCILIFNKLYFIFLIFLPILICLFIRIFRGRRNLISIITGAILSLIGVYLTGFLIASGDLINSYGLPSFELLRLPILMIGEFSNYGVSVWHDLTDDIFNVIFILAYLAVGLMFSWEFILKPAPSEKTDTAPSDSSPADSEEYEYEYVYEDELEPDDIVDDK